MRHARIVVFLNFLKRILFLLMMEEDALGVIDLEAGISMDDQKEKENKDAEKRKRRTDGLTKKLKVGSRLFSPYTNMRGLWGSWKRYQEQQKLDDHIRELGKIMHKLIPEIHTLEESSVRHRKIIERLHTKLSTSDSDMDPTLAECTYQELLLARKMLVNECEERVIMIALTYTALTEQRVASLFESLQQLITLPIIDYSMADVELMTDSYSLRVENLGDLQNGLNAIRRSASSRRKNVSMTLSEEERKDMANEFPRACKII